MSSGLECEVVEVQPGQWRYLLQDGSCPVEVWDWREFASMSRPFGSSQAALDHLRDNHSNPGGWSTVPYSDQVATDPVLRAHLRRLALGHRYLRLAPQALLREVSRGQWFLFLEDIESADDSPSFLDKRAGAIGPFSSLETARAYMLDAPSDQIAPSGYSSQSYGWPAKPDRAEAKERTLIERLAARASQPDPERLARALTASRPERFRSRCHIA